MISTTLLAVAALAFPSPAQDLPLLSKAVDPASPEQAVLGRAFDLSGNALLLGAPNAGNGPGFATLFQLDPTGRATKVQDVTWPHGSNDDYFGWATAVGPFQAAIGARFADPSGTQNAGRVQVYDRTANAQGVVGLSLRDTLSSPQPTMGGRFGESVAIDGSLLAVGETHGVGNAPTSGAIHLFDLSVSPAAPIATLTAPNGSNGDELGSELLLEGPALVSAAFGETIAGTPRAGAVRIFGRSPQGVWSYQQRLTPPAPETDSWFGRGLALDGARLFVGAPYQDNGGVDHGVVYEFERQGGGYVLVNTIDPHQPNTQFLFGSSVAVAANRLYVGASGSGAVAGRGGEIQVFQRNGSSWQYSHSFTGTDVGVGDRFGLDLAVDNGRLITSAKGGDEPHFNSGGAYVYGTNAAPVPGMVALNRYVAAGTARTHYMLLQLGQAFAGHIYAIVGSGDPLPLPSLVSGVALPFTLDAYSTLTLTSLNALPFQDTLGLLDTLGRATALIDLAPSISAGLLGSALRHCAVTIDPATFGVSGVHGPTLLEFVP